MKKILIIMLALTTVLTVGAKEKKAKRTSKSKAKVEVVAEPLVTLNNDVDSMSYALAVNIGSDLLRNLQTLPNGEYNLELFLKAFNTVLKGDSALFSVEDV